MQDHELGLALCLASPLPRSLSLLEQQFTISFMGGAADASKDRLIFAELAGIRILLHAGVLAEDAAIVVFIPALACENKDGLTGIAL